MTRRKSYWEEGEWLDFHTSSMALSVYPDEEIAYSGLRDVNGIPLVRPKHPLGFIDFDKDKPHERCSTDREGNTGI